MIAGLGQMMVLGVHYALKRRGTTSFISLSALFGMALGVMVLIAVLSVMNGFELELRNRILGAVAHVIVKSQPGVSLDDLDNTVLAHPDVVGTAPLLKFQTLLSAHGRSSGILVSGIDPGREHGVSILPEFMTEGNLRDLRAGDYGIVLGSYVAAQLGVRIGDSLMLLTPQVRSSVVGAIPRIRRFKVVGVFAYGAELDATYAYIHIDDALVLNRRSGAPDLRVRLSDVLSAHKVAQELRQQLAQQHQKNIEVVDWGATYGSLFRAVNLEKLMVGLLLFSIVLVAVFNVFAALAMTVVEKRADIAILRTTGTSRAQIMGIFITQGTVLGGLGLLLGIALGVPLALGIDAIMEQLQALLGVNLLDVYFIDYFPSDLRWGDVWMVSMAAGGLALVATLYPSWRASGQDPAEVLSLE